VADSASETESGDLISLDGLPPTIDIDAARRVVTVAAAVRYGDLAIHLHEAGFALHNMGSLPHISVAGSIATGTHGSGDRNGNLATAVTAIDLVTGDGDLITLSREADADTFTGAIVGLGALGVVTHVRLAIEPTYDVTQWVYEGLSWNQLRDRSDEIFASAYSVSVLTRWTAPTVDYVFRKQRTEAAAETQVPRRWLGATLADGPRHPIVGLPPETSTPQLGAPGPWHERLPHFRPEFTPSVGAELQSEYFVPREHAAAAIDAIHRIGERLATVLLVCELRTVAADDLWLSPAYGRDSLAIHFTWVADTPRVLTVLPLIEAALEPFAPRPHWGKLFTMAPDVLAGRYQRHADFGRLRRRLDPGAVFGNAFVDRYAPMVGAG
jgi:xylitol oxidase